MNKLPLILLVLGALLCLVSIGLQGYADGSGTTLNTTPFTIGGLLLVGLGAYLNSRNKKSSK